MPDISLLESIAQIFGVTVSELLQGERETGSESGDEPDTYSDKPSADPYTHTYPVSYTHLTLPTICSV